MSKRSWYVFLAICVLILLSATIYSSFQMRTSFKELVLDQMRDNGSISEMRVVKNRSRPNEQELEITNPAEIERIMSNFSEVKLRKSSIKDYGGDEYEIWFRTQSGPTFAVIFYSPDHVRIHHGSSNHKLYRWTYSIVNGFDSSIIDNLFSDMPVH